MESLKKDIGRRIKEIRQQLNKNQTEFGELLGGIKKSPVSAYENGDTYPKPETFVKIAALGNVTIDWLITGKESSKPDNRAIAATISPGEPSKSKMLMERRKIPTSRNIHIRYIIEWMGQEFSEEDARALFFYEDLKDRYPSFAEFMEKKRPSNNNQAAGSSMAKKIS